MRAPSRRESIFGAIFVVTLVWGLWNYRHLFTALVPTAATSAQPSATSAVKTLAVTQTESPLSRPTSEAGWGSDPFNRPWRATRTSTASAGKAVRTGP